MTRNTLLARGLVALAIFAAAPCLGQGDAVEPIIAAENPAFLYYLQTNGQTLQSVESSDFPDGLVPEPILLPQPAPGLSRAAATLPATFDLRPLNKLTPMRDQGACGSCWSFATYGSLESSLMPLESLNFSENNLKNLHGFDVSCCSGGNRMISVAYLARWAGAISEADDPYNTGSCSSPGGVAPVKHVQEVIYLPSRASSLDNDAIKQAVMDYGAVYTTYYHSNAYYNSGTRSYYYNGSSSANHAVCIVGWDDNYPASSFFSAPAGNGAFLIRNSWGSWWGSGGYFYMSYYDARLGRTENAVFRGEPATNYNHVYQYDDLGWVSSIGYGMNSAWFANVFTAISSDAIAAASWYSATAGASYELRVYVNPTTGPINSTGPAAVKTGTIPTAGYHTIKLGAPVPVGAGRRFSVVVKQTTPGYNYPVPLEKQYSGYSSSAWAATGQSYMSGSGTTWTDVAAGYPNTNVCLKAFSSGDSAPTPGALGVTPSTSLTSSGAAGGPFSPASQSYTLTNSGGSSISWTASKAQSWVSVSPASGTLAAGATATVTVSINSGAAALTAGGYSDTVAFANTTNGSGNATRPVSLSVTSGGGGQTGTYSVVPETFDWIDPSAHAKLTLWDNSISYGIDLPFTFTFYGKAYARVFIGSNGLLGFSPYGLSYANNTNLPNPYAPNAAIYPYWDNLNPYTGGRVSYAITGSAPNRKLVASWAGVPHASSPAAKFTFQAILREGTNDIVFQYLNVSPNTSYGAGRSATIGIENATGSQACKYAYGTYGSVSNNQAIRFTTQTGLQARRGK